MNGFINEGIHETNDGQVNKLPKRNTLIVSVWEIDHMDVQCNRVTGKYADRLNPWLEDIPK